ncbi:Integrator complex subunit 3 [Sesbania bispinosa]|nr:Integrator complex subunit 3 [Sesbania bispinosa]
MVVWVLRSLWHLVISRLQVARGDGGCAPVKRSTVTRRTGEVGKGQEEGTSGGKRNGTLNE